MGMVAAFYFSLLRKMKIGSRVLKMQVTGTCSTVISLAVGRGHSDLDDK